MEDWDVLKDGLLEGKVIRLFGQDIVDDEEGGWLILLISGCLD